MLVATFVVPALTLTLSIVLAFLGVAIWKRRIAPVLRNRRWMRLMEDLSERGELIVGVGGR